MGQLLGSFFRFMRFLVTLGISVIFVLWVATWVADKLKTSWRDASSPASMRDGNAATRRFQERLTGEITGRMQRASTSVLEQLDLTLREVDDRIEQLRRENDHFSMLAAARVGAGAITEQLQAAAARSVELELRQQEHDYLVVLRAHVVAGQGRAAAATQLENLRLGYLAAFADEQGARQRLLAAKSKDGWLGNFSFTPAGKRQRNLADEVDKASALTVRRLGEFRRQKQAIARFARPAARPIFRVDEQRLLKATAFLGEEYQQMGTATTNDPLMRLYLELQPLFGPAFMVVISYFAVPAAIRSFFYYVGAPIAARRPPVVIGPGLQGEASNAIRHDHPGDASDAHVSAVSKRVLLAPDEEMLIRQSYCQSKPQGVAADTRWLFNWAYPLPSIAAHMWRLTRLRTREPAEIVVSSTLDALDEVALLELGAGVVFILQARGLVGAVYPRSRPPRIRSHWRLGTLHAWMTLQLRYLSFEGPATLIVKGRRGVRLEAAASGRTISQTATLGFSAGTAYSTVRNEPFWPYLLGEQPLLQDRFEGQSARYLYEEIPSGTRGGASKRNLAEAMVDAVLKAFGV